MEALQTLREIARDPARVATEWKDRGGKVLGYRCLYIPEEIVWAAGLLPYPLYGTPEPVVAADSYLQSCTCEFIRNVFDRVLAGKMQFLDGMALANTCDVVRHLYDIWGAYVEEVPVYLLNNPQRVLDEGNRDYFMEELRRFRAWVERIAGTTVTDDRLRAAIDLYNETRTLLKGVYALRQQERPPLNGQEALDICTAVTVLPKDQANALLRQLMGELERRRPPATDIDAPRVMVTGSVIDHPALIQIVEEAGALVVAEDLCNTSRYFWSLVEPDDDPLAALYRYQNRRPLCACMHPVAARLEYVLGMASQYDVAGVINFTLKYCHPYLYEAPLFKKALEQRVPTTVLEVGHDLSGHGQLRTRIQAFLEMLELEV